MSNCKFYNPTDDNELFTTNIPSEIRVDDMYDIIRPLVGNPFDLIPTSNGKDGNPLNKNNNINLSNNSDFYVITYTLSECNICLTETSIVSLPQCNHSICIDCYERLDTCPYCRSTFDRIIQ